MKKLISSAVALLMIIAMAVTATGCGGDAKKEENVNLKFTECAVGVQLGTTGDIFVSNYEADGTKVERFNKGADAVVALMQDKIDCVVIDSEPAKAFVNANEGIKILDNPFAEEEYAICVSKDNSDLTKEMNKALKELKADGTVDKIISNFIGDDTKGKNAYESPKDVKYTKELHMATNATFEPYEYKEKEEVVGIDPMIATAICDKLGYNLVIDDMDFDSIITAVQTGKADFGMAGMTVTEERLKSIDFTDTYAKSTQVIIVKDNVASVELPE